MKKRLLYLLSAVAAMLTSCSDEVVEKVDFLNGNEKTPITVVSNISANTPVTRAADAKWEENDMLFAYVQHVKENTSTSPTSYDVVNETGTEPRIQHFKVNTTTDNSVDNFTNTTSPTLSPVDASGNKVGFYWDDFSVGAKGDENDIRTTGHGLRSLYGLCFNGRTGINLTSQPLGTLSWSVLTDQNAKTSEVSNFTLSDLLFSPTQTPVAYAHGSGNGITDRDPKLEIPFTHAMSKVTVVVKCDEGFSSTTDNLASTSVELQNMNTVATITAPTATVAPVPGDESTNVKNVTMQAITDGATNMQKSFSALIVPTVMKNGQTLAKITNVDNNNYDIILSDAALTNATSPDNAWSTQLVASTANEVTPTTDATYNATNGGLTKPGVHYMITVTIKKQEIKVEATIQPWEAVSATGVGVMDFTADIVSSATSGTAFETNGAQFNLWRAATNGVNGNYDENTTNTGVVDKATTLTYSTSTSSWTADPKIYWPNNSQSYFFRALAKYNGTKYVGFEGEDNNHTPTTDLKVSQGTDLIWGTTADHTGTTKEGGTQHYDKGAAINPRTSEVPLAFGHAMSKISVKLESVAGAEGVDVTGAKISIVNIYDGGTVSLTDGEIAALTASGTMPIKDFGDMNSSTTNKLKEFCVIPQSLVKDKDGNDRTGATTFYTPNDLTKIYDNGSSLTTGSGTGTTYVTSTLTAIKYTEEQAKTENAGLSGAVSVDSEKEPARDYTLTEYNDLTTKPHANITQEQFNNLSDAARTKEAARPYTLEEFKGLPTLSQSQFEHLPNEWKTKPPYTKPEADEYNANLDGAVKEGDDKPDNSGTYTAEEAAEHNGTLNGAVHAGSSKGLYNLQEYNDLNPKPIADISQSQYDQLPDLCKAKPVEYYTWDEFKTLQSLTQDQFNALPEAMRTRPAVKYTQDEADDYNAKLPGAKSTQDVHHYVTNADSKTAVAGDVKSNGNKVVLHILLADNTGYTLNLAACKDSNQASTTYNQPIIAWEPGKHYTYTITLGKEEITFRALIKKWEEVEGGGNANLDW